MARRFKVISLFVSAAVLITILVGPPLSFAVNLPTICNIFHKQCAEKTKHCGSQTLLSKLQAKSFEGGIGQIVLETSNLANFAVSPDGNSPSFLPFATSTPFTALRC